MLSCFLTFYSDHIKGCRNSFQSSGFWTNVWKHRLKIQGRLKYCWIYKFTFFEYLKSFYIFRKFIRISLLRWCLWHWIVIHEDGWELQEKIFSQFSISTMISKVKCCIYYVFEGSSNPLKKQRNNLKHRTSKTWNNCLKYIYMYFTSDFHV